MKLFPIRSEYEAHLSLIDARTPRRKPNLQQRRWQYLKIPLDPDRLRHPVWSAFLTCSSGGPWQVARPKGSARDLPSAVLGLRASVPGKLTPLPIRTLGVQSKGCLPYFREGQPGWGPATRRRGPPSLPSPRRRAAPRSGGQWAGPRSSSRRAPRSPGAP